LSRRARVATAETAAVRSSGQPGRIHHGQRYAGRGIEQQQGGDHGRQAARGIARHLGNQLGRQRVGGQRRLDEEQAAGPGQFHHGAQRLSHTAGGEVDQRLFDGRQQGLEREVAAHGIVVQKHGGLHHGS
jgi:hypothetical protein